MLSIHLRLSLSSGLFPSGFPKLHFVNWFQVKALFTCHNLQVADFFISKIKKESYLTGNQL
jgi:hypothetical protein